MEELRGTKDRSDVEGAAGRPTHLAGGARRAQLAMASAAMAADAGFTIVSLVAVPGLLLPDSMFLVGSVSIAIAALSYTRVDGTCVGRLRRIHDHNTPGT